MTINVDETFRAMFYLTGDEQDWMAGINELPDGRVTLLYRFRYYDPKHPGAFDGHDRKSWYEASMDAAPDALANAIASMQTLMDHMQAIGYVKKGGLAWKYIRPAGATLRQVHEAVQGLPFMHARKDDGGNA